jgi:hypothetical protein
MIHQTIHELSDGWTVHTPLGEGTALLITTPSYLGNSIVYVKLADGQLKHFDSNDIRIYGSPTYGETTEIPKEWKK